MQRTLSLWLCPSAAVETAVAQCTSRWAMARGHRLNISIVLAAVHGLSGLFQAVSPVEPSLCHPLPTLSPSLIGHLTSVDVKHQEKKKRLCVLVEVPSRAHAKRGKRLNDFKCGTSIGCFSSDGAASTAVKGLKTKTFEDGHCSFSYAALSIWNFLPCQIRYIQPTTAFKTALKTHLFQTYSC